MAKQFPTVLMASRISTHNRKATPEEIEMFRTGINSKGQDVSAHLVKPIKSKIK